MSNEAGAAGATEEITEEQGKAALEAMRTGTPIPGEDADTGDLTAPQVNYVEEYDPENPTDAQKQALAMGWNPEGVQGKRSVGAEEYIDRQSFFDEIHKLKRENKKITSGVQKLISAQAKARQQGREEALAELKAARQAAAEEGDVKEVVRLSEEIEDKQSEAADEEDVFEADPAEAVQEDINEEGRKYLQANREWYEGNDVMRTYADSIHDRILQQNAQSLLDGNMTANQVFQQIDAQIRAKFPEQFGGKPASNDNGDTSGDKPKRVNRVNEGGGRPSQRSSSFTLAAIPEDQHDLARAVMRDFGMTEEEYVKSYLEGAK